jgi:hypothetical protein
MITYDKSDGSRIDSVDLGHSNLLFQFESFDERYMVFKMPSGSNDVQWWDSVYVLDTEIRAIYSVANVEGLRTVFMDPKDNALIVSSGNGYSRPREESVYFGFVHRYDAPNFKSVRTLRSGQIFHSTLCTSGAMFTGDGIYSTATPDSIISTAVTGQALPSGRYVTIADTISVYDSNHTRLMSAGNVRGKDETIFVAERPDGVITVNTLQYMVRFDQRKNMIDTIQTPSFQPWAGKSVLVRISERYIAIQHQHWGIQHFDLFNGKMAELITFPAVLPVPMHSNRHPYNLRMGRKFYSFDSTFGTITDRAAWSPPVEYAWYSSASDRWIWAEPMNNQTIAQRNVIRSIRTFDTVAQEYDEPFDYTAEMCLSRGGDTVWVSCMQGEILEYDMTTVRPRRRIIEVTNKEKRQLYRIATRNSDSTLVGVWSVNNVVSLFWISLSDPRQRVEKVLDLPQHQEMGLQFFKRCGLVASDRHRYIAATVYPHKVLTIVYDDGRVISIPTQDIIMSLVSIDEERTLMMVDKAGIVYLINAVTGTTEQKYFPDKNDKGEPIDVEYDATKEVLCVLRDEWRSLNITYLHLPTMTRWTWSGNRYGTYFMHDGKNIVYFPPDAPATSATLISLLGMKPIEAQPLLRAFPDSSYRHVGRSVTRVIRSSDGSTYAYQTPGPFGCIAWMKGDSRQILYPTSLLAQTKASVYLSSHLGDWVMYAGPYEIHIYTPDLSEKRALVNLTGTGYEKDQDVNSVGSYIVKQQPFFYGAIRVGDMQPPLSLPRENGPLVQYSTVNKLADTCTGTYTLNHPSYFAYLSRSGELMIRGPLVGDIPIATGQIMLSRTSTRLRFSPDRATLAVVDHERLLLLDGRNFSLIREYRAGGPIHRFDWSPRSTSAYISHSYDTFGKYSFAGVVSVDEQVQPPTPDCHADLTVRSVAGSVIIQRNVADSPLLLSFFSADGRLIRTAQMVPSQVESTVEIPGTAMQAVYVLVSGSSCQSSHSVVLE